MTSPSVLAAFLLFTASAFAAAPVVEVVKAGMPKTSVSINCSASGAGQAYVDALRRNLDRSGHFVVVHGVEGAVKISGTPGTGVTALFQARQKQLRDVAPAFADARAARMAARRFSDALVENFTDGGKGFAAKRIAFVNRKGPDNAELYACYPDGYDIVELTHDQCAALGPRWAPNGRDIYYTGFRQKSSLVYRYDTSANRISLIAPFKGTATGGAVSPNGARAALILSYEGNPELYAFDFAAKRVNRLTRTEKAAEASPCWSPDGSRIAYVSDQTRHPQIYVVSAGGGKAQLFTRTGVENTGPDWSADNKLVWASKRAGQSVLVVADVAAGESSARVVTAPGSWESPSWAPDGRHVVASRDGALFLVDTHPDARDEKPVAVFLNKGNWMNPSFQR